MFEGYGGPVQLNKANMEGIDPCLEDCCRREVNNIHKNKHNAT